MSYLIYEVTSEGVLKMTRGVVGAKKLLRLLEGQSVPSLAVERASDEDVKVVAVNRQLAPRDWVGLTFEQATAFAAGDTSVERSDAAETVEGTNAAAAPATAGQSASST